MPPFIIQLTDAQAWAIGAALAFMALDIVSGFIAAIINNCVSSSKMRVGIGHKVLMCCVIAMALMLEVAGSHVAGLGFSGVTTVAVCVYIVVMEVASVMENVCSAYPELANSKLAKIFEQVAEQESESKED